MTNEFKAKYTICPNIELPRVTFETKTALKCSLIRLERRTSRVTDTDLQIIVTGQPNLGASSDRVRNVKTVNLYSDGAWNLYLEERRMQLVSVVKTLNKIEEFT